MRTPKHYREMAEEVRTCGDLVTHPDRKRRLYECAGEYEAWAAQAEDRARDRALIERADKLINVVAVRSLSWPKS